MTRTYGKVIEERNGLVKVFYTHSEAIEHFGTNLSFQIQDDLDKHNQAHTDGAIRSHVETHEDGVVITTIW